MLNNKKIIYCTGCIKNLIDHEGKIQSKTENKKEAKSIKKKDKFPNFLAVLTDETASGKVLWVNNFMVPDTKWRDRFSGFKRINLG